MGLPLPVPPPGFDDLSTSDKVAYIDALWERLVASGAEIPVPEWHAELVAERLAEYRANPGTSEPWDVVEQRLRAELQTRNRTK